MNKRKKGSEGEELVVEYYCTKGYKHLMSNYTIQGGEIDIIMENEMTTVFIEVKVVDGMDDLFGYVTEKKLYFVHKTIAHYMRDYETRPYVRIDVVFVKRGKIFEVYENVGGV